MEIKLIIEALGLEGAINNLAEAISGHKMPTTVSGSELKKAITQATKEAVNGPEKVMEVSKPEDLHYGARGDGSTYSLWDEMCKAFDTVTQDVRAMLLKEYSENGTYGGVPSASWGKVIEACKSQQAPKSVPIQNPVQTPVQTQVQTTTTTYKLDDLAVAASTLMDAGRQNELIALLQQYGIDSLPSLQVNQYGAFATALRGMGAKI